MPPTNLVFIFTDEQRYDTFAQAGNRAAEQSDLVNALADEVLAWQATLPPGPIEACAGSNAYLWPEPPSDASSAGAGNQQSERP